MAQGDIIRVGRIGFYHYGIDCGDDKVIHYNGEPYDKRNACISEVSVEVFCKGGVHEVVNIPTESTVEDILGRAQDCIGDTKYNLFFNNCEHFAKYCRLGKKPFITMRPQILDKTGDRLFYNMTKNIPNEIKRAIRYLKRLFTRIKKR